MASFRLGQRVLDRSSGYEGTVCRITLVPPATDLLGDLVPAHRRYVVQFDDGKFADDRYDADLEAVAVAGG